MNDIDGKFEEIVLGKKWRQWTSHEYPTIYALRYKILEVEGIWDKINRV